MATGDKADLLASLANNITDNQNKENTPARHRTYASQIITYCLNLVEAAKQTVLGPIDFNEQVNFTKNPKFLGNDIYQFTPTAYCDYSFNPDPYLMLTTTPQVVAPWVANVAPVGISVDGAGVFTLGLDGVYAIDIDRIYINTDNNPSLIVNVTINIEADFGAGFVSIFTRTLPLSSATAGDEPSIMSFTSTAKRELSAGTKMRVSYSAEDNGADPNETFLLSSSVTANLIHNLPEA